MRGRRAVIGIAATLALIVSTAKAETTVPEKPPAVSDKSDGRLLDKLSVPAAGAYGLRKLRSAYTGAAIEVRRSSDNTTAKIGFAENGDLDVAALLKFVGKDSGFIKTWHDQSGNGLDVEQSTLPRQRVIVAAGKPVVFPGTNKPAHTRGENGESFNSCKGESISKKAKIEVLRAAAAVIHPTSMSAEDKDMRIRYPGMSDVYWCGDYSPSLYVVNDCLSFDNGGGPVPADAQIKSDTKLVNEGCVVTYVNPKNPAEKRAGYANGSLVGTARDSKMQTSRIQVSGIGLGEEGTALRSHGYGFSGYYAEFFHFAQDITVADRQKIEGNQAWYYGLEKSLPEDHPFKKNAPKEMEIKK
jgi:hypothetical protein